jgi:Sec-independent protein translocase protein TatA
MEIFGVGPLEFLLILVIALVILGPEDMVGTARKMGQWVYRFVRSPTWRAIIESTQDLRNLPQQIVRDAGLEEAVNEVKQTANDVKMQMADTTREISGEMAAVSRDLDGELRTATGDISQELKASTNAMRTNEEIRAETMQKAMAEGENAQPEILWPQDNAAGSDSNVPANSGDTAAASTLIPPQDGNAALSTATEESTASIANPPGSNPYVSGLETFAQALENASGNESATPQIGARSTSAELGENAAPYTPDKPMGFMPPQMISDEMINAAPKVDQSAPPASPASIFIPPQANPEPPQQWAASAMPWAAKAPAPQPPDGGAGSAETAPAEAQAEPLPQGGYEAPSEFEQKMQARMAEMEKALEKLEKNDPAPSGPPDEGSEVS